MSIYANLSKHLLSQDNDASIFAVSGVWLIVGKVCLNSDQKAVFEFWEFCWQGFVRYTLPRRPDLSFEKRVGKF